MMAYKRVYKQRQWETHLLWHCLCQKLPWEVGHQRLKRCPGVDVHNVTGDKTSHGCVQHWDILPSVSLLCLYEKVREEAYGPFPLVPNQSWVVLVIDYA